MYITCSSVIILRKLRKSVFCMFHVFGNLLTFRQFVGIQLSSDRNHLKLAASQLLPAWHQVMKWKCWSIKLMSKCWTWSDINHKRSKYIKVISLWIVWTCVNHNGGEKCAPSAGLPPQSFAATLTAEKASRKLLGIVRHMISWWLAARPVQSTMLWDALRSFRALLDLVVLQRDRNSYRLWHVKLVKWKKISFNPMPRESICTQI